MTRPPKPPIVAARRGRAVPNGGSTDQGAVSLLCDLSTIEGEAYGQSRNHEYLGRDRLGGREQANQGDPRHPTQ